MIQSTLGGVYLFCDSLIMSTVSKSCVSIRVYPCLKFGRVSKIDAHILSGVSIFFLLSSLVEAQSHLPSGVSIFWASLQQLMCSIISLGFFMPELRDPVVRNFMCFASEPCNAGKINVKIYVVLRLPL